MSAAAVMTFFAGVALPLPGRLVRLLLAVGLAALMFALAPAPTVPLSPSMLVSSALAGVALGLAASIPVHAACALAGLRGELAVVSPWSQVVAWLVFFSIGGPALLLLGLAKVVASGVEVRSPGTLDTAAAFGVEVLGAVVLLAFPVTLTQLLANPLAALFDRLGAGGLGGSGAGVEFAEALRGVLALGALALTLPFAVDTLGALWRAALPGGTLVP